MLKCHIPHKTRAIYLICSVFFMLLSAARAELVDTTGEDITIRDTEYVVPPEAYFVSVNGNDGNEGSVTKPYRTLTRAVEAAPAGATIVMRAGVYRESVSFVAKRLTIQPYPHEQVWLKGSLVVNDWNKNGSTWSKDNWPYRFDRGSYEVGAIDAANPYAGYPDMVFVDGRRLTQVAALADVAPDTFFADYDNSRLYIGSDPNGRVVEASAYKQALRVGADGTIIRGLGFMHYAGARLEATLQFDGCDNVTVENNTIAWAASRGLAIYQGNGATVQGNKFLNNGQVGFASWRSDNVRIEGNRFAGNNQEEFRLHGSVAEAAGAKLTVGKNWIIRGNVFENNKATGLWLDISNHNTNIVSNRVINNLSYGIYYEISGRAIIGSNLVAGNSSGIRISNSSDVKIYNNTLSGNAENISIQDDNRQNTNPEELALSITYVTANIELRNNILSNNNSSQNPLFWARDYNSTPLKSADEMISTCDVNAYHRENSSAPTKLISWWAGTEEKEFSDLNEFRLATGHERNGILIDDTTENPFFDAEGTGEYRLRPDSVAVGAGTDLPADVAEAIGVDPGVPVDLGVLVLDWPDNQSPPERRPLPPTNVEALSDSR